MIATMPKLRPRRLTNKVAGMVKYTRPTERTANRSNTYIKPQYMITALKLPKVLLKGREGLYEQLSDELGYNKNRKIGLFIPARK